MKSIFTLVIIAGMMLVGNYSYASFPVNRETVKTSTVDQNDVQSTITQTTITSPASSAVAPDRWTIALLLWIFLGTFFAAHRWYLGSPIGWNILYMLTFGFFFVGWVIDGIDIITGNYPGL